MSSPRCISPRAEVLDLPVRAGTVGWQQSRPFAVAAQHLLLTWWSEATPDLGEVTDAAERRSCTATR